MTHNVSMSADGEAPSAVDYSLYYRIWHDDSVEHAAAMSTSHQGQLGPLLRDAARGRSVDVGCGMGFAVMAAAALGFEAEGLERDNAQAAACRRLGVPVTQTDQETAWLRQRRGEFALVTLLDVLEHVPHDLQIPLMEAVRESLSVDGRLILTVPNASSPLASHWRYQDWTHTSAFTAHSIRFVLQNAGFSNVEVLASPMLPSRPPLRVWRRSQRAELRRWIVRRAWRAVLRAELGDVPEASSPIDLNLTVVARARHPSQT